MLIRCHDKKRSYRKTGQIESRITEALRVEEFRTAQEIANFIRTTWNVTYSRSIISRHLQSLGYDKDENGIIMPKESQWLNFDAKRETFVAMVNAMRVGYQDLVYVGEATFRRLGQKCGALIVVDDTFLLHYEVEPDEPTPDMFYRALDAIKKDAADSKKKYVILTNTSPVYCEKPHLAAESLPEILKDSGMKHYYIPLHSPDINLANWVLEEVRGGTRAPRSPERDDLIEDVEEVLGRIRYEGTEKFFGELLARMREIGGEEAT